MAAAPPPRLPIGVFDFRELRASGMLYVDKTDFVARVLTTSHAAVVFPRPRRFGKTLNLSTLRYFVEKSKEDRTALFEGLAVWNDTEARQSFQRYPVISLTFKDAKAPAFDTAFASIRREISKAYKEHLYLLKEGALEPFETGTFEQILRAEGPQSIYASSLCNLTGLLARYHGRPVVLLIDEYDAPIHTAAIGKVEPAFLGFFRTLLCGGLKDNRHLRKGVLTSILRIPEEGVFGGLDNLTYYSLLRPEHATSFGFTEAEVKDIAVRAGAGVSIADIERWYDGYRFGGHVIYNPWSTLSYLDGKDKVPRPCWVQNSSEDLVQGAVFAHALGRARELEGLLAGREIDKRIDESVVLRGLDQTPEAVWSLLLFTGHLAAKRVWMDGAQTMARLAIPNKEVEYAYQTLFRGWLEERLGGTTQVDDLYRALLAGDAATCQHLLETLLQSLSIHDFATRRLPADRDRRVTEQLTTDIALTEMTPEQVYHVFVVGLLVGLQPRYTVRSNRESGAGRYDVMITPRTPGQPGVVLELKVPDRRKRETLKSAMASALRQIRDRDYTAELRATGADPIHEMGIVFQGKRALVETARPAPKKTAPRRPAARKPTSRPAATKTRSVPGHSAAPLKKAPKKAKAPRK